ncbi:uncharacterized protein [Spinacia oleracea]|uniref:Retrotransposon Copia-like N-terminal domain-containing protein n=1 Tax=Spinacia oleracea TaxID=3562 RepID=A0ABM3QQN9_SPIOL|nr:uncharacterized protein LOC130461540 [Spinacia oleracea]
MGEPSKFHSALTVTNVKSLIPITLNMETGKYHSWATLFIVQANVHCVLEHIQPPTDSAAATAYAAAKEADLPLWTRLDNVVLQWIYGTISTDILDTILVQGDNALQAWKRVENLFHDNKNTRAVFLETQFTTTVMADFPSIIAYSNRLQSLAIQLANVGAPVSEHRLVLRLLAGLPEAYRHFVSQMQQKKTLPGFAEMCSRLKLEDSTTKEWAARDNGGAALLVVDEEPPPPPPQNHGGHNPNNGNGRNNYRGKKPYRGRGHNNNHHRGGHNNGGNNHGNNIGGGRGRGNHTTSNYQASPPTFWPYNPYGWVPPPPPQWPMPPCPYPTTPWQQPQQHQPQQQRSNNQARVLGARPPQAYNMQASNFGYATAPVSNFGYMPTDVEAAMHTLSLHQPDDNWYMDTGATSHMTANLGFPDGETPNEM